MKGPVTEKQLRLALGVLMMHAEQTDSPVGMFVSKSVDSATPLHVFVLCGRPMLADAVNQLLLTAERVLAKHAPETFELELTPPEVPSAP